MPNEPRPQNSKDAQDVDRLLRKLMLEEDHAPSRDRPGPDSPAPHPASTLPPSAMAVWGWLVLGAVLAGALTQWPYETCGLPLAGYLLGAGMVLVTGARAAWAAWRARRGIPHTLAILLLFTGTAMAAHQVLARVGYAAVQTTWGCTG